ISIGVLFLLNNFYPDFFSWRSLASAWPFLLIGLGVIRLLEVLVEAGRAHPIPPSRFSMGGVFVVVILSCIFWGISKGPSRHFRVGHVDAINMFGTGFDFDVKQSFPVTASDSRLMLEGVHGTITVAGDDSSQITITGHKSIRAFNQRSADQANQRTNVELVRN